MPLTAGATLGPYRLGPAIGAGGMGEVYRAHDARLGRDVAIKILPDDVAQDPERLHRFESEARAAAALNHPHILSVFDVGRDHETAYLVTELLEGRTLREVLEAGGGTKVPPYVRALDYAAQIADGLAAAHARGIVHRDIKPENLFVTTDGRIKILDFGLAKVVEVAGVASGATIGATAAPHATAPHVILGTPGYMAPEQIRGEPVDHRADIFAFGCVLYELLGGTRAFSGATTLDTLSAILRDAPAPLDAGRPSSIPPPLARIVERCLEKTPDERFQSARDLAFALREVASASAPESVSSGPMTVVARSRTGMRAAWLAAGFFALTAVGTMGWIHLHPASPGESVQFDVPPPPGGRLTDAIALSPDGRRLAFVAAVGGQRAVWVRDLDSSTARLLPGTTGPWSTPAWAPDGQSVAVITMPAGSQRRVLKRVDLRGVAPTVLAEEVDLSPIAWGEAGVILFTRDGRLHRVADTGGPAVPAAELDATRQEAGHGWPFFLPGGHRFIFQAASRDRSKRAMYVASLESALRTHVVAAENSKVAYSQGVLFYQRKGILTAQHFDAGAGRLTGQPTAVVEGVANGFAVSANGTLAYRAEPPLETTLAWFDLQNRRLGTVGVAGMSRASISPDGRRAAVVRLDGMADIWMIDLERNISARLTSDPADDTDPTWSADSAYVIFRSTRRGTGDLYRRAANGTGEDELLFESPGNKVPRSLSSDGKWLLFNHQMEGTKRMDVYALPLGKAAGEEHKPFPVVSSAFNDVNAVFSPDGRWIAYQSNESDWQVYVQPFPATGARVQVSTTCGANPKWSADGKQVFFNCGTEKIFTADVTVPLRPRPPREVFSGPWHSWTIDPSGQRLLVETPVSDVSTSSPITVVTNWIANRLK